jgi:hypothetical protein
VKALAGVFPPHFLHPPLMTGPHQIVSCGSDAMDVKGILPLAVSLSTSPKLKIHAATDLLYGAIHYRCLSQITVHWMLIR